MNAKMCVRDNQMGPWDQTPRRFVRALVLILSMLALVVSVSIPAHAASASTDGATGSSEAGVEATKTELLSSSLPRTTTVVPGAVVDTFELRGGTSISVSQPVEGKGARLGGGVSPSVYITLNRADQTALRNGAAAAVGAALCAIPAVGWMVCAGIMGTLAIAMTYIGKHGLCATSKPQLKIFVKTGVFGCVK